MPSTSRRSLLRVVAGLVGGLAGCQSQPSAPPTTSPQTPSPTPRETATTSPTATDTASPTPVEAGNLCEQRWQPSVRWISDHGGSGPAVSDDTVYVIGGDTVFALKADSGAIQWRRTPESGVAGTVPTIGGSSVVVEGSSELTAYDADAGRRQWEFVPPGKSVLFRTSPIITDGRVFVVVAGPEQSHPETPYQQLYGLSLDSGEPVVAADLPLDIVPKQAVATAGRVYVSTGDASLLAFDPASGERGWTRHLGSGEIDGYWQPPAIAGDTLFLAVAGTLLAVSAVDGTVRWRQSGEFIRSPAVGGDRVYCLAEAERAGKHRVVALDASSGRKLWRAPLRADNVDGLTATSEDVFVSAVVNDQASMLALDAETGCTIGMYAGTGTKQAAVPYTRAVVTDMTVYFAAHATHAVSRP